MTGIGLTHVVDIGVDDGHVIVDVEAVFAAVQVEPARRSARSSRSPWPHYWRSPLRRLRRPVRRRCTPRESWRFRSRTCRSPSSRRIVTLLALTMTQPRMSLPSMTAPAVLTVRPPSMTVRLVPGGTPVFVASGNPHALGVFEQPSCVGPTTGWPGGRVDATDPDPVGSSGDAEPSAVAASLGGVVESPRLSSPRVPTRTSATAAPTSSATAMPSSHTPVEMSMSRPPRIRAFTRRRGAGGPLWFTMS